MNILLNPLQRLPLVQQADVEVPSGFYFLTRQKPPWTNPVVKASHDDGIIGSSNYMRWIRVRI